jgi:hypothetical protein
MVAPLFAQTSNSNASGNFQTEVLLTVSPFRASFVQPPVVHPTNRRFFTPLFSAASELLFSQLLCFHNHLRCPLVFAYPLRIRSLHRRSALRPSPRFHRLTNASARNPFHSDLHSPAHSILSATPVPGAYCANRFSSPPLPRTHQLRLRALPVSLTDR